MKKTTKTNKSKSAKKSSIFNANTFVPVLCEEKILNETYLDSIEKSLSSKKKNKK